MKLRITIENKTYDVDVEVLDGNGGGTAVHAPAPAAAPSGKSRAAAPASAPAARAAAPSPAGPVDSDEKVMKSPIPGSILQLNVAPGDSVALNQVLLVMEAMKMETNIASPREGRIAAVHVRIGESVRQGQSLVEFE
jgi:biotin carboxyl carrier protein